MLSRRGRLRGLAAGGTTFRMPSLAGPVPWSKPCAGRARAAHRTPHVTDRSSPQAPTPVLAAAADRGKRPCPFFEKVNGQDVAIEPEATEPVVAARRAWPRRGVLARGLQRARRPRPDGFDCDARGCQGDRAVACRPRSRTNSASRRDLHVVPWRCPGRSSRSRACVLERAGDGCRIGAGQRPTARLWRASTIMGLWKLDTAQELQQQRPFVQGT